jgi:hypothetical protein
MRRKICNRVQSSCRWAYYKLCCTACAYVGTVVSLTSSVQRCCPIGIDGQLSQFETVQADQAAGETLLQPIASQAVMIYCTVLCFLIFVAALHRESHAHMCAAQLHAASQRELKQQLSRRMNTKHAGRAPPREGYAVQTLLTGCSFQPEVCWQGTQRSVCTHRHA